MLLKNYSRHPCLAFNFEHEHTSNGSQDKSAHNWVQGSQECFPCENTESENKHNSVKTLILSSLTGSQIMCHTFMSLAQGFSRYFSLKTLEKGIIRSNIYKKCSEVIRCPYYLFKRFSKCHERRSKSACGILFTRLL